MEVSKYMTLFFRHLILICKKSAEAIENLSNATAHFAFLCYTIQVRTKKERGIVHHEIRRKL